MLLLLYYTLTISLKLLIDIIALTTNILTDTIILTINVTFKFSDKNFPKTCIAKKLWSNPIDNGRT